MHRAEVLVGKFEEMVKATPGRPRFGKKSGQPGRSPDVMNCCKLEQAGTNEHGRMLKRIQILEDGRVLAKEAKNWKIEGQRMRINRKEFEMGGFIAQEGLWNLTRDKNAAGQRCVAEGRR